MKRRERENARTRFPPFAFVINVPFPLLVWSTERPVCLSLCMGKGAFRFREGGKLTELESIMFLGVEVKLPFFEQQREKPQYVIESATNTNRSFL